MSTYKLSKSGIERLERFKRDIESGDFIFRNRISAGGNLKYIEVHTKDSVTCCFVDSEDKAKTQAVRQINKTLTGRIEKQEFGYCVIGGCGLGKRDVELI